MGYYFSLIYKGVTLNCPKCANEKTTVPDTKKLGAITKRVRLCKACNYVFYTIEKPELIETSKEEIEEFKAYMNEDL